MRTLIIITCLCLIVMSVAVTGAIAYLAAPVLFHGQSADVDGLKKTADDLRMTACQTLAMRSKATNGGLRTDYLDQCIRDGIVSEFDAGL